MDNKQRGVAIIEFALVLPLLLILTFITTEFGRALYQYNTITKSVRDAARYLSVQDPTILTSDPGKVTNAKNLVVYGNFTNTSAPLALGLSTTQVPNPVWQTVGSNPVINTVTIKVTGYVYRPLFASAFGVNFGNIAFADISAAMRSPS
jgi:Flp pilus assembly protein TadG